MADVTTLLASAIQKSNEVIDLVKGKFSEWDNRVNHKITWADNEVKKEIHNLESWKESVNLINDGGVIKDLNGNEIVNFINNGIGQKKYFHQKIGFQNDYRKIVIPLVNLTDGTESRAASWSQTSGIFEWKRTNGCCSNQSIVCHIRAMKKYNSEDMELVEIMPLPRDNDGNLTVIKPVKFNYNEVLYGGIEVVINVQSKYTEFTGVSTEFLEVLSYWDTDNDVSLIDEISDSIEYL